MSKSTKVSFTKSRFFVEGILKKPPVRVKGRRVSSSRKSKGIPVEGIPKKVPKQVKGRKVTSSKQSKGLLRSRASRKKRRKTQKGGRKRSRLGDKNLLIIIDVDDSDRCLISIKFLSVIFSEEDNKI